MVERSPRNKTMQLTATEITALSERLVKLDHTAALQDVQNTIINQDLIEACSLLPPASVDLLIMDPPYNLTKTYNKNVFKSRTYLQYLECFDSWIQALIPLLKPTASIYICSEWRSSPIVFDVIKNYFHIQNRIVWQRDKGRGAKSNWKNNSEDIWFCTMGKDYYFNVDAVKHRRKVIAPYRNKAGKPKDWQESENGTKYRLTYPANIWTDLTVPFWSMPENTPHPTQKPEKLIAKLVLASSKEGDLVLDPFVGSGTTAVVAQKLKRHFIGIDLDQEYCCYALKRLETAESETQIQGYSDGAFWERNVAPRDKK